MARMQRDTEKISQHSVRKRTVLCTLTDSFFIDGFDLLKLVYCSYWKKEKIEFWEFVKWKNLVRFWLSMIMKIFCLA